MSSKDGPRPPAMSLPAPPLTTVHTPTGTRIDFLEPVFGAGVFVTEAGPVGVDGVWAPLARAYPKDIVAAYAALEPGVVVPDALIDAADRARRYTSEHPASARVNDSDDEGTAKPPSWTLPSVAEQVFTNSITTGSGCGSTFADFGCSQFHDWAVCQSNLTFDAWFQRVDNDGVWDQVCVFTSQFVQWRVQVRPWYSWSILGDFTVEGSTWRRVFAQDYSTDYDYHSNVFNVAPDGYHHGASGAR